MKTKAIDSENNRRTGFIQRAGWFARRGFAVVIADSRGRFDSDGDWDPFNPKHKTDGYDHLLHRHTLKFCCEPKHEVSRMGNWLRIPVRPETVCLDMRFFRAMF